MAEAENLESHDDGQPQGGEPTEPQGGEQPPNDGAAVALEGLPENWREIFAGGDEKRLNALGRFTDPLKFVESWENAQNTIRSGRHKQFDAPTEDADLAAWRTENGIPETFDKYELTLDDGIVVGDEDKVLVDQVLEALHGENATPAQASAALNAYYKIQAQIPEMTQEMDQQHIAEVEDSLREEWGSDYRTNRQAVSNFVNRFPESVRDSLATARSEDGKGLLNNADVVKTLAQLERLLNPAVTILPNSTDPAADLDSRIKEIEAAQRDGGYTPEMREEYAKLMEAKVNMGGNPA